MTAVLTGDLLVTALTPFIPLGQLVQGSSISVAATGDGSGDAARFLIEGSPNMSFTLIVEYNDLVPLDAEDDDSVEDIVAIDEPLEGEAVICYHRDDPTGQEDSDCHLEFFSTEGDVPVNDTRQENWADVGYSVTVDAETAPGTYANDQAIVFTVEATLQGQGQGN